LDEEIHLAGIVVYADAAQVASVAAAVNAIPGARVHAASDTGKLVVTLEASGAGEMASLSDAVRGIPGVLDAAMVYQHAESLESMNQEISDGTHP
jgi:nitrate reductase NapD